MKMNRNDKTRSLTPVEEAIRYFDPYPNPILRMMAEDYESRQRKKNKFDGEGDSNIEKTLEPYSYNLDDTYSVDGYHDLKTGEIKHINAKGNLVPGPMVRPKNLRHYISSAIMQLAQEVDLLNSFRDPDGDRIHPYDLMDYNYANPDTGTWFDEENGLYKRGLHGGSKSTWYETLASNLLDVIGRPTFVTTGVQPIHDNGYEAFYDWICGYPMMDIEKEESRKVNSIKGLDIRKDKDAYKFVRPNVLSDLAKPSVRESLGVTDIVNPLWEITVTPEYTHDDFNDKYKK